MCMGLFVQCGCAMKQILVLFITLASFFMFPAFAQPGLPKGDFSDLRFMGTARVTQVIDPQTVQFQDGTLVHLTGLDLPDYTPDDAGDLSVMAMSVLKDMLVGKDVNFYQRKDKELGLVNRMEHKIGHLERKEDGAWIQGTLVSLGIARVRTTQRNPEMAGQLYELEMRAREEKSGLWAEAPYSVLKPEETPTHVGSFAVVEGTIKSAAMNKNRVYLNFGDDWRTDFTVSIAPEHRRAFSRANIDPLQWNGKTIRVRGWLDSYNGPTIEIDHPQAIEIPGMKDLPQAAQMPIVKNITAKP